jgi:hypothetical protein
MAGIVERDQSLKRESLADLLTIVDKKSTPFLSQVKKGSAPKNSLLEWGVDKHKTNIVAGATYTSGVSDAIPQDGVDTTASDFENYDDRAKCQVYVQYARRFPKVSRLANMVSDVAGVGYKKEMANSIAKSLVSHKRDICATLCSSQETNQETSSSPYQTRGLGKWITDTAQSTLAVPAEFLTPTESIGTSTTATAKEEDLRGILQSIYEQTGESDKSFFGLCGTGVKKTISEFTLFTPRTNNIVMSNRDTDEGKLATSIDIIDTDFGVITLNLSSFLEQDARDSSDNYDASVGQNTLFILNMSQLEVAFAEETNVRELPDLGGGARSLVESVFALKSYSGGLDHGKYTLS